MIIYDISFKSPEKNLACDDMLLEQADNGAGTEVLRLWESPVPFVVLGRVCRPEDDVNIDECRREDVDIFQRRSGGGTVVQGPGCLNFSFILCKRDRPGLQDLHRSYQEILTPVIDMLSALGVRAVFQPISDLALDGSHKKFSGNAQRRLHRYVLHHGTILYRFDLSLIERCLTIPKRVPEYRAGRTHVDFLANIGLTQKALRAGFCDSFPHTSVRTCLSESEGCALESMVPRYKVINI